MQGRQHGVADALQDFGHAAGEVVVQQHEAGREAVGQMHALAGAQQGLEQNGVPQRGFEFGRLGDFGVQAAQAHGKAGLLQDIAQGIHVFQIERIARVVFRHNQHGFGRFAVAFYRVGGGSGGQRAELGV